MKLEEIAEVTRAPALHRKERVQRALETLREKMTGPAMQGRLTMTTHENIRQLLTEAPAFWKPPNERLVRLHAHECVRVRAALDELAAVSSDCSRLPPDSAADLLARTEARRSRGTGGSTLARFSGTERRGPLLFDAPLLRAIARHGPRGI